MRRSDKVIHYAPLALAVAWAALAYLALYLLNVLYSPPEGASVPTRLHQELITLRRSVMTKSGIRTSSPLAPGITTWTGRCESSSETVTLSTRLNTA